MAKQSEKHSLEEKQKKGRGTKRKQDWNGDEPVVKRRGFDTPSPISLSRPNSVTSSLLNDTTVTTLMLSMITLTVTLQPGC